MAPSSPPDCRDYYLAVFERADGRRFNRAWAVEMPCEFAAYAPAWFTSFIANRFSRYDSGNGMVGMMINPTWTIDWSPLSLPLPMPAVAVPVPRFNADRRWLPVAPPDGQDPAVQRAAFTSKLWRDGPWHPFVDDGHGEGWMS